MNKEFNYKIVERIAVLSQNGNATKELNIISYDGAPAKYDLRNWKHDGLGSRMFKGITLTDDEFGALVKAIAEYNERTDAYA